MPAVVTEQGTIHYQVHGRGRPVLLLHGYLGSWALWRNTIEELGKEFRLYAIDFWGFGESREQNLDFSITNFMLLIKEFMERLGIVKAPLVGHSMGGTVSLGAALRYPEQITKLVVVGTPIHGASLSPLLKFAGFRGWISLARQAPFLFDIFMLGFPALLRTYARFLAKDGKMLGDMLSADVAKVTWAPFFQSINTLRRADLRREVEQLDLPILGIYGKKDRLVDPKQSQILQQHAPHSQIAWFENAGHFPMMDDFNGFIAALRAFLHNQE